MASNSSEPIFFYSTKDDTCAARGFSFNAPNNTAHGDLCAYIPAAPVKNLWACPAPDSACWTIAKPCLGKGGKAPSDGQISCINDGTTWCCNKKYERCTGNAGQAGICWADFVSPLKDVTPSAAASIGSSARAASETVALNSRLSAISAQAISTPSVSSDSSSSAEATNAALTGSQAGSSLSTAGVAAVTGSSVSSSGASTRSMDDGAVAGIIIGCIAGIVLIFAIALLLLRRKRRIQRAAESPAEMSTDSEVRKDEIPSDRYKGARPPPDGNTMPIELPRGIS